MFLKFFFNKKIAKGQNPLFDETIRQVFEVDYVARAIKPNCPGVNVKTLEGASIKIRVNNSIFMTFGRIEEHGRLNRKFD